MGDWIFQANPKHYDVVSALTELEEIVWRVPQHTGDIRAGDGVFIWRSGKDAGIVGVGTVAARPALRSTPESERRFVLDPTSEGHPETRVPVRVSKVKFVDKSDVAAISEMADHQICTAPMGTVFALNSRQAELLLAKVSLTFPAVSLQESEDTAWPAVFSWKDRRKDAYPLPGGYLEQVDSLLTLIRIVSERRPTMEDLTELVHSRFSVSATNARHITLFIRRMGFVDEVAGLLEPSGIGTALLESRDEGLVLALLHQRARFIGEMLAALTEPKSTDTLLDLANKTYGMGWTTKAQIQRRRGWLQSVGAIQIDDDGLLSLTDVGQAFLERLELHVPESTTLPEPGLDEPVEPRDAGNNDPAASGALATADDVRVVVDELITSATDSGSPDRFERAIAEAFAFLGFRTLQLGGAGKTDVLADADLGRDDSYRIIIDGKTTGNEAVGDNQIDWDTIDDHRALHEADYVVVAGPAFRGSRVVDRATDHDAILMTANDLAELVRQHAMVPLDLDAYRGLLASGGGKIDIEGITESVEASQRFLDIALASMQQIEDHVSDVGPMSARDIYLLLRNESDLEASEAEILAALDALASPLAGVLVMTDHGFRPSSRRATSIRRLQLLATDLQRSTTRQAEEQS